MTEPNFPEFTPLQRKIIDAPLKGSVFLKGLPGTGKTTCGVARLIGMVESGVLASSILILVPQRSLGDPYRKQIESPTFPHGPLPTILTFGGLAQRMVDLFWPIIAQSAGFRTSTIPPKFLTLETAQYFMARIAQPMIQSGVFESLTIDLNRLYSQILDNLNKSSFIGFSHESIGEKLSDAWIGEPTQLNIFQQTQLAASEFRSFCQENNLLDYSSQIDIFLKHVWPSPLVRGYLTSFFHHLIYENLEEDVPVAHDFIHEWLPDFESSLLIFDENGGYRTFLGADPKTAISIEDLCNESIELKETFTLPENLTHLDEALPAIIRKEATPLIDQDINNSFEITNYRFTTDMVNGVADEIRSLIQNQNISPSEIVVISPFMSDALKFSLKTSFDSSVIPNHSIRYSRSIENEPAARNLIAIAKLGHPAWGMIPTIFELRSAFLQTIAKGDLNRADLLTRIVLPTRKNSGVLGSFNNIHPEIQSRITYSIGDRFEILRTWLQNYSTNVPMDLDVFISKVFGEVLSQAGFGYHDDFESARVVSQLITSVQNFRRLLADLSKTSTTTIGSEYIQMVESGVLAAQFYDPDETIFGNSVLISPAYSYLMTNRSVAYQFWLDIGRLSWWERVNQPLTQPFVLSRNWSQGRKWTDADEYESNQRMLAKLVSGLIRRCRKKIFFFTVGLNEYGLEEKGPLMQSLQVLMKRLSSQGSINV